MGIVQDSMQVFKLFINSECIKWLYIIQFHKLSSDPSDIYFQSTLIPIRTHQHIYYSHFIINMNNNKGSSQFSLKVQLKYTHLVLSYIFGRYHQMTNQIVQIIINFLFSSPFRKKHVYVLKQGTLFLKSLTLNTRHQTINMLQHIQPIPLKQHTNYIVTNKFHHNQKLTVTKIWVKPATRTQKKILTYCDKFKQFLLGKHLSHKTIDIRFLKRQFLISFHELQQFEKHLNNIKLNDVTFCSFDVIDSYMALVTKNWIQIQLQVNQHMDKEQKAYKVIPEGCSDKQILTGITVLFEQNHNKWYLKPNNLILWQEQPAWSRKQTLIKTTDGKVQFTHGNSLKSIHSIQPVDQ